MNTTLVEKACDTHRDLILPVSSFGSVRGEPKLSPFYQLKRFPEITEMGTVERAGRDIRISTNMITAFITGYASDGAGNVNVYINFKDSTDVNSFTGTITIPTSTSDTLSSIDASVPAVLAVYCDDFEMPYPDKILWLTRPEPVFSSPSLAVNTARQVPADRVVFVSAAVDITASLSLAGGQTGRVTLQYADNSGFSTNVVTVNPAVNGNTGTLTVGLGLTQVGTATVCGFIPAEKYYRLLTTNVTGTPTYGTPNIQETII